MFSSKLITNQGSNNHNAAISDIFKYNGEIFLSVAFLKKSGLDQLMNSILDFLRKGNKLTVICGLDFGLTEPKALLILHNLSLKFRVQTFICIDENKVQIFHPKLYMSVSDNNGNANVIIGSANLTSGGLLSNNECSILTKLTNDETIYTELLNYLNSLINKSEKCTLLRILQYQKFYDEQKQARKGIKAKPSIINHSFNYINLKKWYIKYQKYQDVDGIFLKKSTNYDKAKIILDTIADTRHLTKNNFIPLFEKLVGSSKEYSLWHSGSIYRMKSHVFNYPKEFQKLVNFVRDNIHEQTSTVYISGINLIKNIYGSGVNTLTEILMTYDRGKFANLNKNPITVLSKEGGVKLKVNSNSFSGDDYELYCQLILEISNQLGLRNMLEADSFFNDIYWQLD